MNDAPLKSISPKETFKQLEDGNAILIDVREQDEYDTCRIDKTPLAALSNLPQNIKNIEIPKDKKIVIHCLKGGRSADAILFLQEGFLKGYDLYNMEGGILKWIEEGLPVLTNEE